MDEINRMNPVGGDQVRNLGAVIQQQAEIDPAPAWTDSPKTHYGRTGEISQPLETLEQIEARRGKRMLTASGRFVYPLTLRPDEVDLLDVAHHLAMLCRFNGATNEFYNVAQHAVSVAREVPEPLKIAALLHDAPEAYLGDQHRPIKTAIWLQMPGGELLPFEQVEERVSRAVFTALDVAWPDDAGWAEIKAADDRLCRSELIDLLGHVTVGAASSVAIGDRTTYTCAGEWWHTSKKSFLNCWRELTGRKAAYG